VGSLPVAYLALVVAVALQRIVELAWSRRNLRGRELDPRQVAEGRGAYAAMVAVHVALLVCPLLEVAIFGVRAPPWVTLAAAGVFAGAQALRIWALTSLGRTWNTRAAVDPDTAVVATGPYRHIRHPNYLAVLLEFVSLPAIAGAWLSLALLNLIHAPILARRIRGEEALLERLPQYAARMAGKGRFLPRGRGAP